MSKIFQVSFNIEAIKLVLKQGAMSPIFSFLLSQLLFEVSSGAQNVSANDQFRGLVLGIVTGWQGFAKGKFCNLCSSHNN